MTPAQITQMLQAAALIDRDLHDILIALVAIAVLKLCGC